MAKIGRDCRTVGGVGRVASVRSISPAHWRGTKGAYDLTMAARHTDRMQRFVPDRRHVAFQ